MQRLTHWSDLNRTVYSNVLPTQNTSMRIILRIKQLTAVLTMNRLSAELEPNGALKNCPQFVVRSASADSFGLVDSHK